MKLFKRKNNGPKVKREDVVIPEEYLEYERQAEQRRNGDIDLEYEDVVSTLDKVLSIKTEKDLEEEASSSASTESIFSRTNETELLDEEDNDQDFEEKKNGFFKRRKLLDRKPKSEPKISEAEETQIKEKSKISGGMVALFALLTALITAIVVLLGPLMSIDAVQITKMKNMTDAQIIEMANNPVGQNLFRYSTSKAEAAIELQPYVQSVKVKRHFPHWIEIVIDEREPAGILLNNSTYLQFSKDGVLLDSASSLQQKNLPLVTGFSMSDVPSPGEKFGDNARFSDALAILNACTDELLASIQEINIEDRQNILAYTSQGIEIRLGNVKNINERMAVLNDIINQVVLSNAVTDPIAAIDIRYEKAPVIVLEGYENYTVEATADEGEEKTSKKKSSQTDDSDTNGTTSSGESLNENIQEANDAELDYTLSYETEDTTAVQ